MFGDECVAMRGMQSLEDGVYKLWLDLAGSRSKCGMLMMMLKGVGLYLVCWKTKFRGAFFAVLHKVCLSIGIRV